MRRFLIASIAFLIVGVLAIVKYVLSIDGPISFNPTDFFILGILPGLSFVFFMAWIAARKYKLELNGLKNSEECGGSKNELLMPADDEHLNMLERSMSSLIKQGRTPLTENQKNMWRVIQKEVPASNPLKKKLNKIHFTCDFEDLEGFKTQFVN